jgi:hypothetical protein
MQAIRWVSPIALDAGDSMGVLNCCQLLYFFSARTPKDVSMID